VVQIKDTLHLETFLVSTPLAAELADAAAQRRPTGEGGCAPQATVVGVPGQLRFDAAGNLARLA
jgi:hypothetical protein